MSSYVKTLEELKANAKGPATFFDAQFLQIYWETKPDIVEKLLPPGLKPGPVPLVSAFVANYPRTNFFPPYKEAGLYILADHNGTIGNYCLSMPVTDDMAMAMGRENCSLPKKLAQIDFSLKEDDLHATVARHGITFFTIDAKIGAPMNSPDAAEWIRYNENPDMLIYNVKFSRTVDGTYDLPPTLVSQPLSICQERRTASCSFTITDSPHDPWIELEVVRVLGASYSEGDNVLKKGSVLGPIPPKEFAPYSNVRWDWWTQL